MSLTKKRHADEPALTALIGQMPLQAAQTQMQRLGDPFGGTPVDLTPSEPSTAIGGEKPPVQRAVPVPSGESAVFKQADPVVVKPVDRSLH